MAWEASVDRRLAYFEAARRLIFEGGRPLQIGDWEECKPLIARAIHLLRHHTDLADRARALLCLDALAPSWRDRFPPRVL